MSIKLNIPQTFPCKQDKYLIGRSQQVNIFELAPNRLFLSVVDDAIMNEANDQNDQEGIEKSTLWSL